MYTAFRKCAVCSEREHEGRAHLEEAVAGRALAKRNRPESVQVGSRGVDGRLLTLIKLRQLALEHLGACRDADLSDADADPLTDGRPLADRAGAPKGELYAALHIDLSSGHEEVGVCGGRQGAPDLETKLRKRCFSLNVAQEAPARHTSHDKNACSDSVSRLRCTKSNIRTY